ncbi:acyltransferase [Yersinia enterocolitica]|uniref:acyltransferase family protein n=1 Tax=Yersinia enterocolitica TaxID=630 RepID=UPI0028BC4C7B|nr:acyltransferase [Yersinia enterocolitica]EKN4742200.1 acyltransferase [Yersinia enterocolitica]EKN4838711.1 acyltransferase [Yersinia enterocolitica]EKN6270814.1 acyltransferase [Yersinia enterocolitica]ELI8163023.1 acyltransferase [Yersinia enterocolitica]
MNNKYLFAQYLRGLAALSVLFAHFGTSFFNANDILSSLVNVPTVEDRSYPWVVQLVPVDFPGFMAVFGVSIFFMISGFVIPMSIERYSIANFFSKRFFRLFPTYAFVFTLNLVVALIGYVIYRGDGVEYVYNSTDIIGSYFIGLNTYIAGTRWLDPVAWTLGVEILFYVIAAIYMNISFAIRKIKEVNLYDIIILSAILDVSAIKISKYFDVISETFPAINLGSLIKALYLISFMLLGTTFFLHAKKRIGLNALIYTILIQYFAFVYVNMHINPVGMYVSIVPTFSWFAITILVFSLCYSINDKIKEHKVMEFFADISYPLYLCHLYIGHFMMGVIINLGIFPRSLVVFMPFPVTIFVAYLIHKYVEMNTNKLTFSGILRLKRA